jgi:hypothetical protein
LFGIGKRTVFKVLKDSPENFRDLSTLADCDTDKSIDAASKLVCRLYDQKGKLKEDHVDLNKLRVRLATLMDACLAKLPPWEATFTQHVLRSSLQINIWMRWVFSLRHKSPAWQRQRSVQDRLCSKQMHPFMHTDFPLQVQTRSCKKSEDIWPLK